jgi:hypothetical protein
MNAKDWNRIDDMLQQIRRKLANVHPQHEHNRQKQNDALDFINALLELNEQLADAAFHGWF